MSLKTVKLVEERKNIIDEFQKYRNSKAKIFGTQVGRIGNCSELRKSFINRIRNPF